MNERRSADPELIATMLATARVSFGCMMAVAPQLVGRVWLGDAAENGATRAAIRAVGARDVAIGTGLLVARRRGRPVRGWTEAGVLTDALDFVATAAAFRHLPAAGRLAVLASTASATVAGMYAARGLTRSG